MAQELKIINNYIIQFDLTKTSKENFINARNYYNNVHKDSFLLFTLVCFSFNNILRFNSKNEFNTPIGKRDFNISIQKNLVDFIDKLQNKEYIFYFYNKDFKDINVYKNSYVFCDPPYLISEATYNKLWNKNKEIELLNYLDDLNNKKIKFGLTNVTKHKGKENEILINWSKKYRIFDLNNNYINCAYNKINKESKTSEVFVCNYQNFLTSLVENSHTSKVVTSSQRATNIHSSSFSILYFNSIIF